MQIGLCVFLAGISLFSSIFADADSEHGLAAKPPGKRGVYFCTRDVAEWQSKEVPSSKSLVDYPESIVVVDENDSEMHKQIRHCFVLLANERVDLDVGSGKLVLEIHHDSARGYYPDDLNRGHVLPEDYWLFDKQARDERTISCTPVMQEGDINKVKESPDVPVSVDDLYSAWNILIAKMYQDASINRVYDRNRHNCCGVAFESLRKVNKDGEYVFDLSNINKRSFNVFGRGISFDSSDDSVVDYLKGGVRIGRDFSKSATRITMKKLTIVCNKTVSSPDDFSKVDHGENL